MIGSQPLKLFIIIWFALSLTACLNSQLDDDPLTATNMVQLHQLACTTQIDNSGPWGITNLYDCETQTLFIPYQLWTGSSWQGNKQADCMHLTGSFFVVDGESETTIKGPEDWLNPTTGLNQQIWIRDKVDGSKTQYFGCHEKGIGRVYDSRGTRYYKPGRCKFPAGFGWKIGKRRYCKQTSISISELKFDQNYRLEHIIFKWWYGNTLDHIYRYKPDYGMTDAWQQYGN